MMVKMSCLPFMAAFTFTISVLAAIVHFSEVKAGNLPFVASELRIIFTSRW
jgi:hypothetical protein